MSNYIYTPEGTCSTKIDIEIEGDTIRAVRFTDGCDGNAQGLDRLVAGRPVAEVMGLLRGVTCGKKETSCPDQLARALEAYLAARP